MICWLSSTLPRHIVGIPFAGEGRLTSNLSFVCLKGRWTSLRTARIHLCDGAAQLSELQLAASNLRHVRALALKARPD